MLGYQTPSMSSRQRETFHRRLVHDISVSPSKSTGPRASRRSYSAIRFSAGPSSRAHLSLVTAFQKYFRDTSLERNSVQVYRATITNMHCERLGRAPKLNIPGGICKSSRTCWQRRARTLAASGESGSLAASPDTRTTCNFPPLPFFPLPFLKDERFPADADILYDALRRVNIDFLVAGDRVAQFLTENLKAKVAVLNSVLNKDDSKAALSTKDEHPEWFADLETNYVTKVSREGIIVSRLPSQPDIRYLD